jgi:dihydrofolate reductase
MGKLIYSAIASLDGYVADSEGDFTALAPDEEVHAYVNDVERRCATQLYGRRMYEVLAVWETMGTDPDEPAVIRDFAQLWRAAQKVVYSTTLTAVASARTRIARAFVPDEVRALKAEAEADISIGGPHLAAEALRAGLVDELYLLVSPVVLGGGTPWLPGDLRLDLTLLDERRFAGGVVSLHYAVAT